MFILDTNVVSELRKVKSGRANENVLQWVASKDPQQLFLSAISVLEIDIGILTIDRRDVTQANALKKWRDDYVLPSFEHRILDVTLAVCRQCASLHIPDKRPDRDAFIAATALQNKMTVVTRNTKDFADTGVALINPWQDINSVH